MDPPDAYKPPAVDAVPYEQMHASIQLLMDEHKTTLTKLDEFEKIYWQ